MMRLLALRGVTYETAVVPPYRVLHDLSPREAVTGDAIDDVRRLRPARAGSGREQGPS